MLARRLRRWRHRLLFMAWQRWFDLLGKERERGLRATLLTFYLTRISQSALLRAFGLAGDGAGAMPRREVLEDLLQLAARISAGPLKSPGTRGSSTADTRGDWKVG